MEVELDGRPAWWLQVTGSYAFQISKDDVEKDWIENSPEHLAKLKFTVPLGRKLELSSGMQYQSALYTLASLWDPPAYIADFTLTSRHLMRNVDFQFGIRNAFNRVYYSPVALSPLVDSMQQPGRSFYLRFMGRIDAKVDSR